MLSSVLLNCYIRALQITLKWGVFSKLSDIFMPHFDKYSDFLFGLFLGLIIYILYDLAIGKRRLKNSHEIIVESKNETIKALNLIIHGKINALTVQKQDKRFFSNLKKYFK